MLTSAGVIALTVGCQPSWNGEDRVDEVAVRRNTERCRNDAVGITSRISSEYGAVPCR